MANIYKDTFHSVDDFWDRVSQPYPEDCTSKRESQSTDGPTWYGTKSYAEALNLARYGWAEGLDKIKRLSSQVNNKLLLPLKEIVPVYDVVGEIPDVGAFLSGEPEHMVRFEMGEGTKRIIKIVVNMGASCHVSADTIEARGAAIAAAVDAIENQGIRVELWLYSKTLKRIFGLPDNEKSQNYIETWVSIKRPEEPLNLDRLSFMVIHPSMFRRLMFKHWEMSPKEAEQILDLGYGYPGEVLKADLDKIDIYFPALSSNNEDKGWKLDNLQNKVVEILQKAQVKII